MYPIFKLRILSTLFALFLLILSLFIYILPFLFLSKPPMTFKRVVFPQPDGPNKAIKPALSRLKDTLSIT